MTPERELRETIVSSCPVPSEQLPINEYQALKESCFFGWATGAVRGYLVKLASVGAMGWSISAVVAAASFSPRDAPAQFLLSSAAGAVLVVALVVLRLYLGWKYIGDRLAKRAIPYEESGWYDGRIWSKTPEIFTRDKLIVTHQVQPILQRLHRTLGWLGILSLAGGLTWSVL
jgi:hypothetical protein